MYENTNILKNLITISWVLYNSPKILLSNLNNKVIAFGISIYYKNII